MDIEITKTIKTTLIKRLREIRDISGTDGMSCHEEHRQMEHELNELIDFLRNIRKGELKIITHIK